MLTMTAHHHSHRHHDHAFNGDPRCDDCGKRHSRSGRRAAYPPPGATSARSRGVGGNAPALAIFSVAALLLAASASAFVPLVEGRGVSLVGGGAAAAAAAAVERVDYGGREEFEMTTRRLQDAIAATNETVAVAMGEEDHEGEEHEGEEHEGREEATVEGKPYGAVIGATLLVNVATLSGLVLVIFTSIHRRCHKLGRDGDGAMSALFDICIYSFAAGALLATAVFLVLPEALALIRGGHDEEEHAEEEGRRRSLQGADDAEHEEHAGEEGGEKSESVAAAQFGCAFIGGFLLPLLFAVLFHVDDPDGCLERGEIGMAAVDVGVEVSPVTATERAQSASTAGDEERVVVPDIKPIDNKPVYNMKLIAAIVLGDSMHNFADGMFIAASFQGCDPALALTIVAVTLVHEFAQELGDFVLLTRHGGLSIVNALVLNFVSGLSVVLGGVLFLALNPRDESVGIILAIAAGVYVNIAATEALPRIETIVKTRWDRIWTLFGIILGTIPIGLVLLNHEHC
ncbi:hypothetical protein ACHAW5_005523 [Stephanodiscus triporus]|uniref:Uncharacterized protein n=1 Tax=Stephanodiscus triporus TaxID=2934178 RepID=A0ABD3NHV4_9STRA